MIRTLIVDPSSFFEERPYGMNLKFPILLVGIVAILDIIRALVLMRPLFRTLSVSGSSFVYVPLVMAIIATLLTPFAVWLLYSGAFHAIATVVFDASGELRRTVKRVGWGFVPRVFGQSVVLGFVYWELRPIRRPESVSSVGAYLTEIANSQALTVGSILSLVFVVWSAFIWLFAIKHEYDISLMTANFIVGPPIVIEIAWLTYQIL